MRAHGLSLAVLVLLAPASGLAETHKIRASGAACVTTGQSTLLGGQLALEMAPWNKFVEPPLRRRHFSIILEGTAHGGSHDVVNDATRTTTLAARTQYSILFGPRFTLGKPKGSAHLYLQGLTGNVTTKDKFTDRSGVDQTIEDKTWALGGGIGVDFTIPNTHGGIQAQVNVLRRLDSTSGAPDRTVVQLSLGIMIKFEE